MHNFNSINYSQLLWIFMIYINSKSYINVIYSVTMFSLIFHTNQTHTCQGYINYILYKFTFKESHYQTCVFHLKVLQILNLRKFLSFTKNTTCKVHKRVSVIFKTQLLFKWNSCFFFYLQCNWHLFTSCNSKETKEKKVF